MKKYRVLTIAVLLGGSILLPSCTDTFADVNSDPKAISELSDSDIRYLFTKCEAAFQPADYSAWYGGYMDLSTWAQTTLPSSGVTSSSNRPNTEANGCGYAVNEVLRYTNEIRHRISLMSEEVKPQYEYLQYLCQTMCVYLSIEDADMFGSRQYSEAEQARYTNPPILTPKYDTQAELLEMWIQQLDEVLDYLTNNTITQDINEQDFIYKGDLTKWAKLTNSLKLRIAARLINKDRSRAFALVEEAVNHPAGLILTTADDFVFNKGKFDNNWNNDITVGAGSQHLIDFLKKNQDPRLFYFFEKNDFNANVVQAYFDQGREMPSYIEDNVEYTTNANGKKQFTGWKAPGEPWVRFYGLPVEVGARQMPEYADYFDPTGELFSLYSANGAKVSYAPYTLRNVEMVKGCLTYTYPDAPDVAPTQDTQQYGWYGLYFSAAETNLLLAEFKLLGANVPGSAQEYFTAGITASVQQYDYIASQNHIPYYDAAYANDPYDVSIKLQSEWLTNLLEQPDYQLTGDKATDLEKVYIQQYLHYFNLPNEQYVTILRSGVPKKNSTILPRMEFDDQLGDSWYIPRRFPVSEPTQSDLLHDITIAAYEAQGYTYSGVNSNNPENLHNERTWMDQENPDFGTGPKM